MLNEKFATVPHPERDEFGLRLQTLRTALFWVIMQRVVVISYRRFGTTYRSHPQGSTIQKKASCRNTEFI